MKITNLVLFITTIIITSACDPARIPGGSSVDDGCGGRCSDNTVCQDGTCVPGDGGGDGNCDGRCGPGTCCVNDECEPIPGEGEGEGEGEDGNCGNVCGPGTYCASNGDCVADPPDDNCGASCGGGTVCVNGLCVDPDDGCGNGCETQVVTACYVFDQEFDHKMFARSFDRGTFPADPEDPTVDEPNVLNSDTVCQDVVIRRGKSLVLNDALNGGKATDIANYAAINLSDTACGDYGDVFYQVGSLIGITVNGDLMPYESQPWECNGDPDCTEGVPFEEGCDHTVSTDDLF